MGVKQQEAGSMTGCHRARRQWCLAGEHGQRGARERVRQLDRQQPADDPRDAETGRRVRELRGRH
jgi:hypothetical protein